MFFKKQSYLSEQDEQQILAAIEQAENDCLAEIRVHLAKDRRKDIYSRAIKTFKKLGMEQTELRNGVLFYIVPKVKKYVILGDKGIHEKVGDEFWESVSSVLKSRFLEEDMVTGIVDGILMCGEKLKKHFPITDNNKNINELPNEISRD